MKCFRCDKTIKVGAEIFVDEIHLRFCSEKCHKEEYENRDTKFEIEKINLQIPRCAECKNMTVIERYSGYYDYIDFIYKCNDQKVDKDIFSHSCERFIDGERSYEKEII